MGKPLYLLIGHTDQISNLQSNSYIITMVKDVCQVSQSIARQKNKKIAGVVTTAPSGKPQGKPPFKALEYGSSIQ